MNNNGEITLTRQQARRALLSHHGLWPPRSMRGWIDVNAFFDRVGSMQFDPVDVAGISPEISLCARVRGFRRGHLHAWLYSDRALCDVWDKNACIARVEDHPVLAAHRARVDGGWRVRHREADMRDAIPAVLQKLRDNGPLSTSAFQSDPAQHEALGRLLQTGEVGVHHRDGRRRFFDLNERLLPPEVQQHAELEAQAECDWFVLRRIGGVGLLWNRRTDAFLGMEHDAKSRGESFERLYDAGRISRLNVGGIKAPLYYRTCDAAMLDAQPRVAKAALLGPLDNLLWDRRLIRELFDFHYAWEVYVPKDKRVYGSYTIPVLYGDSFVGRMQLAQKDGALSVEGWWAEDGLRRTKAMRREIDTALGAHAAMLGAAYDDTWEM